MNKLLINNGQKLVKSNRTTRYEHILKSPDQQQLFAPPEIICSSPWFHLQRDIYVDMPEGRKLDRLALGIFLFYLCQCLIYVYSFIIYVLISFSSSK